MEHKSSSIILGYARVSTDGQSLDSQCETLRANGCETIYQEKESGAKSDRAEMARAIAALQSGDTLLVTRLDRLARSMRDLMNLLHEIEAKGARFRSLSDPWCDTTTAHGRLLLTVLGGIAEFERSLILARTTEGRARAVARGVKLGRKYTVTPIQRAEILARLDAGESAKSLGRSYRLHPSTIRRIRAERAD